MHMAFAGTKVVRGIALIVLPLLLIVAARLATFTDWAAENSTAAALLFAWLVVDTLALVTIAKAPQYRPGVRALLGAMAVGSLIVIIGAAEPVREAILAMSPLLAAMVGTMLIYIGWSSWLAFDTWSRTRSAQAAISQIIPPRLAHFVLSETKMLRIGLLKWGAKPDIPCGTRGFAYHRYLTPMLATFLALQCIEIAVVHLLVGLWSETAALVLLALSVWGAIWLIALMKSFRLYPVLLDGNSLRVRSGTIVDCSVPLDTIERVDSAFSSEQLKARSTLNLAFLSSPNIHLTLSRPVKYRSFLGATRQIDRIGLRLDDSQSFLTALSERLR